MIGFDDLNLKTSLSLTIFIFMTNLNFLLNAELSMKIVIQPI